jgi:uracil-DNA glycosylase family 4
MLDINQILADIEAEARRAEFPVDAAVYEAVGKDPLKPIAFAGNPNARVCSFGRDPGRDEVRFGQPQVGAAGRLVRQGVLDAVGETPDAGDKRLESALEHVYLTNTVPYKPPGNKAYPNAVKERFRPFMAQILLHHWQGNAVITLGTEAFNWFAPYAQPGAAAEFWKREDRYEAELPCLLTATSDGEPTSRQIVVCPLPHPSPLNQRWLPLFPGLLATRLKKWLR